MEPPPYLHF